MSALVAIKRMLRPWRHLGGALGGFGYDYWRFFRYGGWRLPHDAQRHEYRAVKTYHRLEKSLCFRERRPGAGWSAAEDLVRLLRREPASGTAGPTTHAAIGVKVLHDFVAAAGPAPGTSSVPEFARMRHPRTTHGGAVETRGHALGQGRLEDPERFFESRHSVRDFEPTPIDEALLERAVAMAMRTPSVCNRQAWHVYHAGGRDTIDRLLALQDGNAGFGKQVPGLLVVTADLRAFDTLGERFQHWIDGGMFAMSLVLALHSLGLSTCCLNWSRGPAADLALRRAAPVLSPHHSVIMMIAFGSPADTLKVCFSARKRPVDILTSLDPSP